MPPVCKISDYGRLKYEQSKKDKDTRKKQKNWELKEVKLRPKIETHDYETKARMAERLLLDGGKVKVTIMFRGREITYTNFGKRLLDRMAADMTPIATVERDAKLEGKNMFMILAPRAVPTGPPKFTLPHEAPVSAPAGSGASPGGHAHGVYIGCLRSKRIEEPPNASKSARTAKLRTVTNSAVAATF